MFKILLVEDDAEIRNVIEKYFSKNAEDMELETASDGQKGAEKIFENEYDLILLDVMLPEVDGFTLCRQIREKSITPVIFITARGREEDVLYGYENGCDDYIVKPFRIAELHAKSAALIKRSKGLMMSNEIVCGNIRLDPVRYTVKSYGSPVDLAPKEYAVLRYLIERKGMTVSRDALLTGVWGYDYEGSDRVVDNHIKKLRKKLGDSGDQIVTVKMKGYRLDD